MSAAVNSSPPSSYADVPSGDAPAEGEKTPIGYSDVILGVASWPSTTTAWRFLPAIAGTHDAALAVRIAMQSAGLLPAATAAGDIAAATAGEFANRFDSVGWQLAQPDMQLFIATSLNQPAGGTPIDIPVSTAPLRSHAWACHAFGQAAAVLGAAMADPVATATLADVSRHHGVDWQALGLAARDRPLGTLVHLPSEGLLVPLYANFLLVAPWQSCWSKGLTGLRCFPIRTTPYCR